jgi:phospholipid transport system substrate-binding protein
MNSDAPAALDADRVNRETIIRGRILVYVATLVVSMFIDRAPALAAGPEDGVNGLHAALLSTMKDGRTLGESGRYARIGPVVQRVFDIPSMARLAVGASWSTLSAAQQEAIVAAFGGYISATYADRFDSYSGQQLEVIGQQPSSSGIVVKTHIVKANGERVSIDYLMRQSGGDWRISDVLLDGTVSQLATQRSEFGAILRRDGFDGLITTLQRKVNLLTGNLAKAS